MIFVGMIRGVLFCFKIRWVGVHVIMLQNTEIDMKGFRFDV